MKAIFLFLYFSISISIFGQTNDANLLIDKKIDAIPENLNNATTSISEYITANFKSDNDKIRAVYYWTVSHISYDLERLNEAKTTLTEKEKTAKTLTSRKGICEDYALIFNELANLVGVKTFQIQGYSRQNGKIDILSHAWCAASIDKKWYLFDPTWGAGFVDKNKYFKKINNNFFKVAPDQMIHSHMPFDYLWQFMSYPITNQEFISGKTLVNKAKKEFDFAREINRFEALPKGDAFFESAQRIEKNGIKNQLILEAFNYAKEVSKNERENQNSDKFNKIVAQYNEAVNEFNDFIFYRNNKFKPILPDDEIKSKITKPIEKFKKCQEDLFKLGSLNSSNNDNVTSLKKSIADQLLQSDVHLKFVNSYLSKGKLIRKTMFTKLTYFGVPLN
ncbi:transglutaminase domain-containing protein [Flavobacterium sp.]|uniref:transglutaminase domain-containing protein n=1 Tax=Flavobacterium sp. TaxID=239 RepID=UPI0038FCC376